MAIVVFILGEEFLKVLVNFIGGAILEQLGDLVDCFEQVWRDEAFEELKVKLVERLHRKSDCLCVRHLKFNYNTSFSFPSQSTASSLFSMLRPCAAGAFSTALIII